MQFWEFKQYILNYNLLALILKPKLILAHMTTVIGVPIQIYMYRIEVLIRNKITQLPPLVVLVGRLFSKFEYFSSLVMYMTSVLPLSQGPLWWALFIIVT